MKKLLCIMVVLIASIIPARAEHETYIVETHSLDMYETSYSANFPKYYSAANPYTEVLNKIYEDLINHKIQTDYLNGVQTSVISCNISTFNISGKTYDEFKANIDQLYSYINYDIINTHGELFYITSNVGIKYRLVGGEYKLAYLLFDINDDLFSDTLSVDSMNSELTRLINQFHARCDEIIAQSTEPGMTDAEKVLALHDVIVDKVSYDKSSTIPDIDHRAYSAIMGDVSVCQGYTLAYTLLLNKVGIETKFVPSNAMSHAWNVVKLDDEWYHIDITWNDQPSINGTHRFFLVSDEKLQEHYGNESYHHDWTHVVDCTSTKYENNYFFNTQGFTTRYKKGFFWFKKNGNYYKAKIDSSPVKINKSEYLPNTEQNITICHPFESTITSFKFADKTSKKTHTTIINNTANVQQKIKNIIAVYNNNGTLDNIIISDEYDIPIGTRTYTVDIEGIANSDQYIKLFIRKDDLIYPYSNYVEIH